MKFIEAQGGSWHILELTRRNLEILLEQLDTTTGAYGLVDPDRKCMVKSVEDSEHYTDRPPGAVYSQSDDMM